MKGSLKTKSALSQFLFLLGITVCCFFLIGAIGALLVSMLTGVGVKEAIDLAKLDLSRPEIINFLRGLQVVQFISMFVVPVVICSWFFSDKPKQFLGLKAPTNESYFIVGTGVMLIAFFFTGWLGELNRNIPLPSDMERWMTEKENDATRTIQALLSRHTVKDLILNLLCIATLAAVGEELLFRGMAQRILIKLFRSPWAGIIVSSIIFSAMHMQFYGFLPRLVLGILLGLIYWYSGSLWVSILAHFVYDAVIVVLVYLYPEMLKDENTAQFGNAALLGALSFAAVVLLVLWMKKRSKTTYASVYAEDAIPVKNHPF